RDAVRMTAVRQLAHDPARRAALLRECEEPADAHGWMECAADAVREPAWSAAVPDSERGEYSFLTFNRDGSVLASRFTAELPVLSLWRVGLIGKPETKRFPS